MYGGLHYTKTKGLNIPAGFIHVPFMTEQALSKTAPSLPLTMIAEGLRIAVETTLKTLL